MRRKNKKAKTRQRHKRENMCDLSSDTNKLGNIREQYLTIKTKENMNRIVQIL